MKVARWLGIWILFGAMSVGAFGETVEEDFAFYPPEAVPLEVSETEGNLDTPEVSRGAAITFFGGIGSFPESNQLTNRWLVGLFLENVLVDPFYLELEGSLGENRYRTVFGSVSSYQYNGGATFKIVPRVGPLAFEAGAGALFSYYDDLVLEDILGRDRWTVSARIMAGLGWHINESLLLGVRGDVLLPFAVPRRNQIIASPADFAVRRTQLRVFGTLTWEL